VGRSTAESESVMIEAHILSFDWCEQWQFLENSNKPLSGSITTKTVNVINAVLMVLFPNRANYTFVYYETLETCHSFISCQTENSNLSARVWMRSYVHYVYIFSNGFDVTFGYCVCQFFYVLSRMNNFQHKLMILWMQRTTLGDTGHFYAFVQ